MALKINWTKEAEDTFNHIIEYLADNWSEIEIKKFINRTDKVLRLISEKPELYRKSKKKNIHEAVVTKHNTLYYKVKNGSIELITFWDNRQSENKLEL